MKARLLLLAFSSLVLSVYSASAGVAGMISDPEWFKQSNKILVLEYENPFGGHEGVQLSELIGRMALGTTTGVDKFAVITLRQEEKHKPLTEANVEKLALRQRTPVVIWGEFYEENEGVFVTSHLRFASIDTDLNLDDSSIEQSPLRLTWDVKKLNIRDRSQAYASLPAAQVNFSPLKISTSDLRSLEATWRETLILHEDPKENSVKIGELKLATPYQIIGSEGRWTHVITHSLSSGRPIVPAHGITRFPFGTGSIRLPREDANVKGWVRLGDLSRLDTFNELTSVVCYAQGLMQFYTQNYVAAAETFKQYLQNYASSQDSANQAIAHLIIGYCMMKRPGDLGAALNEFEMAKRLLPNSSSPVNCMALALFEKVSRSAATGEEMQQLETELVRVIRIDSDLDAIRNLETLYQLPNAEQYFGNKSANFMETRQMQLDILQRVKGMVRAEDGH